MHTTDFALPPAGERVDVWEFPLRDEAEASTRLSSWMAPAETARIAGLATAEDRRRRMIMRGVLRWLTGRYLAVPPETIAFAQGPWGKPWIAFPADRGLQFSASDSRDRGLIAFAHGAALGVDLEWRRDDLPLEEMAERILSSDEAGTWRTLGLAERPAAFFRLWVAKEAYLKGVGTGLAHPMNAVTMTLSSHATDRLRRDPGHPGAETAWSIHELKMRTGFAAALAIERSPGQPITIMRRFFDVQELAEIPPAERE